MKKWIFLRRQKCKFPGLYAIYLDGELAYIGQSRTVNVRLAGHALEKCIIEGRMKGKQFTTMKVKVRQFIGEGREDLEKRLISRLSPPLNKAPIERGPKPDAYIARPIRQGVEYPDHWMHLQYG